MPAYNEEWCIYENIRTTRAVLEDAGITAEIVAVDDGSRDNTRAEIERAAREFGNVVAARNPYNMGKGMALRTGFECSSGEIVAFLDADLDLHPSQIRRLIETLDGDRVDIVTGSKHHPESTLDYPASRKFASWGYYLIIKTLFNLPARDTQTGLKVFRRTVLDDVFHRLLVKKFAYDIEMLAVAVRFGYTVREVPVVLDFKRRLRWGRIRLSDVLHMFVDTLAIFYRLRILRYYDAERPPVPETRARVIAVVTGGHPSPEVMVRFEYEGITRIACFSESSLLPAEDGIPFFSRREDVAAWVAGQADDTDIVAFLGADCLPVGAWVRSAERNFADSTVDAVCGPVLPGPFSGTADAVAGMVFSSVLNRGCGYYLSSYRRVRPARVALIANLFLRTSLFRGNALRDAGFAFGREYFRETGERLGGLRYDPDIAVSRRIPPFTGPYLRAAGARAYREGFRLREFRGPDRPLRGGMPFVIMLVLAAGWMALPGPVYCVLAALYGAAVVWEGASYFSPTLAIPAMAGILAEHLVRAIAFPAGVIAAICGRKPTPRNTRGICV